MAEAMSETSASSWYDDAPITDEQIESVRRDLDLPPSDSVAAFAPFVVRKMLTEIDRLHTVLDANRVVRNAAESSSRTYKAVVDRLKVQRTELRAENDSLRAQLAEIGETRRELKELAANQAAGGEEGADFAAGYANGLGDAYRAAASLLDDGEVPE